MFATKFSKAATVVFASALLATFSGSAFAETGWERSHPRRDQVNDRLGNQDRRINHEYREGEIGKGRAQRLHREDRQIRREEQAMASRNGGHITPGEQHFLNRQEDSVSRQIGR